MIGLGVVGQQETSRAACTSLCQGWGWYNRPMLSDSDQIRNLLGSYCARIDHADYAGVGALFGDDGVLATEDGVELARGASAIAAFYGGMVKLHAGEQRTKHLVSNTVVEEGDDGVVARSSLRRVPGHRGAAAAADHRRGLRRPLHQGRWRPLVLDRAALLDRPDRPPQPAPRSDLIGRGRSAGPAAVATAVRTWASARFDTDVRSSASPAPSGRGSTCPSTWSSCAATACRRRGGSHSSCGSSRPLIAPSEPSSKRRRRGAPGAFSGESSSAGNAARSRRAGALVSGAVRVGSGLSRQVSARHAR